MIRLIKLIFYKFTKRDFKRVKAGFCLSGTPWRIDKVHRHVVDLIGAPPNTFLKGWYPVDEFFKDFR